MAVRLDKTCRLTNQTGLPLVYVDYIETAPWNLERYVSQPRYRGCGLQLILAAITLSSTYGWAGRIGLHSLEEDKTIRFYSQICGMTEMAPDGAYYNLRYFEMTEAQAQTCLQKGG